MQLKIQTKHTEGTKSEKRKTIKTAKRFDELLQLEIEDKPIDVLGVPYGGHLNGRDSDGQMFHENTDIWLKFGDEVPITYYHGFGPDDPDDWQDTPVVIGVAKYFKKDARGFWFEVRFDETEPLARRIILEEPQNIKASSGAIGHLVRVGDGNTLDVWPVGELALFDTNEWRKPANELAVFEVRSDTTKANAQALTSADAVDVATEPIAEISEPIQEHIKMEDETVVETPQAETPAPDTAVLDKLTALEAKFNSLLNEKPINAPTIIKAENLGSPDPTKSFMHYLRTGERVKGLKSAMGEGTAGVGGYLVPDDFYTGIVEKRNELSIARRAGATILQTSRDVLNIPIESTSQTYFAQAAHDMAAVDEDEPTVDQVAVNVYAFTKLVKVSEDLLDDNAANLNQFLTNSFGRWAAMTENRNVLIGAGTTAPQGVTVGGTAALTFDDTNSIAAAEIPELYYKLPQAYRDNAVWTLNDDTVAHLRGLASSSVFTFGPHNIDNEKIMNRAYYTSTYMPKFSTTKYKAIVFGDWSMYALVERKGMTIRRLNELYAGNRQVGLLATFRMGGAVMQSEAFAIGAMA